MLGTARTDPGIGVNVRLTFERGSQVVRYVWADGRLVGVRVLDRIPTVSFCTTSATEFATFSLRQPAPVKVKFAADEKGAMLTIAGEGGEISARKTK